MPGSVSVVPITNKVCRPFLLEVMVFSPESGFKFKVIVERSCTPDADELWKLVFDLYRVPAGGTEVQLVHVSYTTATVTEQASVKNMATEGVKPPQAKVLVEEVHPAAKAIAGKKKPTAKEKKRIKDAMSKVVNVSV